MAVSSATKAIRSAYIPTMWLFHLPQGNNISPSHKVAIPSATDGNNISHHISGNNISHHIFGNNISQQQVVITSTTQDVLLRKTFSHTPDEARSVGLAKACVFFKKNYSVIEQLDSRIFFLSNASFCQFNKHGFLRCKEMLFFAKLNTWVYGVCMFYKYFGHIGKWTLT